MDEKLKHYIYRGWPFDREFRRNKNGKWHWQKNCGYWSISTDIKASGLRCADFDNLCQLCIDITRKEIDDDS